MELCGPCQNIDIRDLLQSYLNSKAATHAILRQVYSTEIQHHHSSITALQDAARAGCKFCRTIWAHHCHFWSRKSYSDAPSANYFACHGTDACACRVYKGPLHFVIHKPVNEWPNESPRLIIISMANSEKSEIPNLLYSRSQVIAEFDMCIAKSKVPRSSMAARRQLTLTRCRDTRAGHTSH